MAGGKETPRQKMIGMMYLVLLAMLAMNVSKQIINAFVTLDSKLGVSEKAIISKNEGFYAEFEGKKLGAQSEEEKKLVKVWQDRALEIGAMADRMSDYLVMEASDMIKEAEGKSWHETDENTGRLILKPLMEIDGKDKYDEPTRVFVGPDPGNPNERGVKLYESMHYFRDSVCQIMATYDVGKKKYSFTPTFDGKSLVEFDKHGIITNHSELSKALSKANPEDTSKIINVYKMLSLPAELENHHEMYTWQAAMFDHAPIVAAAAIFTSMKVDVRNAEAVASEFLLAKVDAPTFKFNKIEPLAFAKSGYINQGDSLALSVMIAAYDSTAEQIIKYGIDADTLPEKWKTVNGKIGLNGDTPGAHKAKGVIMVEKKGELVPKPWEFSYTVGAPMGVVSLPEMRVLYRGYNNIVEGTASGFPADKVTLSGSGCSLSSKGNGQYVATVGSGVRSAKISVNGQKEDGSSVNLGSFDFQVKSMPTPNLYLGGISTGQTPGLSSVRAQTRVSCRYDESVPLTGVNFQIVSGKVSVDGIMKKGKVGAGGNLDGNAKQILAQSKGKQVTIMVNYKGPDGRQKRTSCVFTTR